MADSKALLLREALALLLLALVVMLIAALYSFDATDPSMNVMTHQQIHNLMGMPGAYIADLLYQLLGWGSWFVALLGAIWAWRVAWGIRPYTSGWTSWFWLPFLLSVMGLVQLHDSASSLPAGSGGALGTLLAQSLSNAVSNWGAHAIFLTVMLSSFVVASHVSLMNALRAVFGKGKQGGQHYGQKLWASLKQSKQVKTEKKTKQKAKQVEAEAEPEILDIPPRLEPEVVEAAGDLALQDLMAVEPALAAEPPLVAEVEKAQDVSEVKVLARQDQDIAPDTSVSLQKDAQSPFVLPSLSMFPENTQEKHEYSPEVLQKMGKLLEQKLLEYKVEGRVVAVQPGPVVLQFELELAPGTKSAKVVGLQADLARSMAAHSVRVVGNIPGKNVIGIELPNAEREMVVLREVLASPAFRDKKHILPLALGVDIAGQPVVVDLAKMPHLLVAGTTGSGKSVAVNAMICSMLMTHTPESLRLIMVDPKMLELSMYDDIPHLLVPVVTSPHKANKALAWSVFEMERRYKLMSEAKVRNLAGYNQKVKSTGEGEILPLIVIIIDELADLMMVAGKEVEQSICRLAQKARAAGLHLILATQRPSVDVITGLIKANLPSRLACKVSSKIDSRTILDQMGAEQLLGMGDSLFLNGGGDLQRVHGAFVSDQAVMDVVAHLKTQGEPDYREEVFQVSLDDESSEDAMGGMSDEKDARYDEAATLVIEKGKCSVSMVQRYLRVGYNRASRIVEQMEQDGLVTPPGSGGQRKVLARSDGGVVE